MSFGAERSARLSTNPSDWIEQTKSVRADVRTQTRGIGSIWECVCLAAAQFSFPPPHQHPFSSLRERN